MLDPPSERGALRRGERFAHELGARRRARMRGYRAGRHLTPEHTDGRITFDQFLTA